MDVDQTEIYYFCLLLMFKSIHGIAYIIMECEIAMRQTRSLDSNKLINVCVPFVTNEVTRKTFFLHWCKIVKCNA